MDNNQRKQFLKDVGIALFGERWQTDLSRELKLSDPRRLRQWLNDERQIPPGIIMDLVGLMEARQELIKEHLTQLKAALKQKA
ncbi:hypothetical protein [Vibrio cholerae]|uniref:hypothetical protein n=1 Tax=Vibrio cholerae TaxID=666 RepID=UPI0029C3F615|nr:hypothetical protein [Vibrio cholerae]MDX5049895.1 hypothetical protein [Vibrio cholerae]MVF55293.1 hypothetical protein [Vibrio cholerae]